MKPEVDAIAIQAGEFRFSLLPIVFDDSDLLWLELID